jgi:hypothetical protein
MSPSSAESIASAPTAIAVIASLRGGALDSGTGERGIFVGR